MEEAQLTAAIEAILFISEKPVTFDRLREVFGDETPPNEELRIHLDAIKERYQRSAHGFEIREAQGGFHFVTKPATGDWVRKFLQTKPFRLGRSALEVLAIIAYRQPITRAEIDQVRGIDSSHLLRTLIERGIVKMAGKAEVPGRPVQYGTTEKFLEVVGLKNVGELPPLSELEQLQGNSEDPVKVLEEGLQRFIDEEMADTAPTEAQVDSDMQAIDSMIQSANQGTKEVHESPEALEVAKENEAALEAFQSQPKPRRRKQTLTYDQVAEAAIPEPAAAELPPDALAPDSESEPVLN